MLSMANGYKMANNMVNSNVTITAYEQSLLAWKALGEFPVAASKTVPTIFHTVGLLANTILLIYLIHSKKCRLPIFALLTSLAICDWLTSFGVIISGLLIFPELAFVLGAKQVCQIIVYVTGLAYTNGICHVMALAAMRFYQLVYPLQAKVHVTTGRVMKCCLGMWLFCALISMLYPINVTIRPVPYNDETLLILDFDGNKKARKIFISIFAQGIPLVVITLLHLIKLFKVTKASQISGSESQSSSSRTVALLIMCFVVFMLPRFLHMCYHTVLGYAYSTVHMSLVFYANMISFSNSIVNPFLYLLSSKEIRQDMYKMVRIKTKGPQGPPTSY